MTHTKRYCHHCCNQHGYRSDCYKPTKRTKTAKTTKRTKMTKTSKRGTKRVTNNRQRKSDQLMKIGQGLLCPSNTMATERLRKTAAPENCPICLDVRGKQNRLGCGHHLCGDCYGRLLKSDSGSKCPLCRAQMFCGKSIKYRVYKDHHQQRTMTLFDAESLITMFQSLVDEIDQEFDYTPPTYEDFEEYWESEEQWWKSLEDEKASDEFTLLYEAAPALLDWRKQGGQVITREMEAAAEREEMTDQLGEIERITNAGQKTRLLTQEKKSVVIRLIDIYQNLFSVSPPSEPYSQTGQILGELKRIFGYSSWVTEIPDDLLQIKQPYWLPRAHATLPSTPTVTNYVRRGRISSLEKS